MGCGGKFLLANDGESIRMQMLHVARAAFGTRKLRRALLPQRRPIAIWTICRDPGEGCSYQQSIFVSSHTCLPLQLCRGLCANISLVQRCSGKSGELHLQFQKSPQPVRRTVWRNLPVPACYIARAIDFSGCPIDTPLGAATGHNFP